MYVGAGGSSFALVTDFTFLDLVRIKYLSRLATEAQLLAVPILA
jgi:hypothetical protein